MGPLFRSLVNLGMCQSAVNFSVRQNVVRNIFFLNIYNLGTVNPTEVRRISKWPHEQGLIFFISDAEYAHRCASDAHRCASAKIGAWPALVSTQWQYNVRVNFFCFCPLSSNDWIEMIDITSRPVVYHFEKKEKCVSADCWRQGFAELGDWVYSLHSSVL